MKFNVSLHYQTTAILPTKKNQKENDKKNYITRFKKHNKPVLD